MKIVDYTAGHYEVQDVQFGKVYRWCPESLMAECECGEKLHLTVLEPTCERCGVDHAVIVKGELAGQYSEDEAVHPWRYPRHREDAGLPF